MSRNRELADMFDRMAQVIEVQGGNRFRANALQRGARALRDLSADVAECGPSVRALTEIDGVGEGLAERIVEYLDTGRIDEYDRMLKEVPAGVIEMLDIPGLGPKTVATLWKQGGVETVDQLKAALDAGEIEKLPRLGAKTVENIRKSLQFIESAGQRVRLGQALPVATYLVEQMSRLKSVVDCDYAGSLRRGKQTIGDIDILLACAENAASEISEHLRNLQPVADVIASGQTKTSVRLDSGLQVDLRLVRPDRYGAALAYFTGSKAHNVALRERSLKHDMSLNEYGLWHKDEQNKKDAAPVAAETEADIHAALGLAYIPPELREDRGEIDAAADGRLPELITRDDIRCELHAHTTASDGHMSIEDLAAMAKDRGFHTVAVTDHSASQIQANGLSAQRLERHIEAVHAAHEKVKGIKILAGSEVDVLADGRLDYPNSLLRELDIVVASPHTALSQDSRRATGRLVKAVEHPLVHIIGHATGRLIGRRQGLSPDMHALFEAAAESGTAFEINANPWRLDLRDTHAR
ncbi:MAG: DNA polymerase/3'-5' exonuclease PolX, partial [Alphaproteobacteria bacterium]|nr:DNA polymerase/3'-5' exonuclease PolX [Alphaproteobacteria bacterium]